MGISKELIENLEVQGGMIKVYCAYISWIKFTIENSPNNNYIQGYIGAQEWNDGPFIHKTDNINPFCSLDYIIPSRSYKSSIFNVILICINN